MFIGIKVVKKALSIKKSLYVFGIPICKVFTNYAGHNKIKTKIYIILLPIIFILSSDSEKKIKVLGITLYTKKSVEKNKVVMKTMVSNMKEEIKEELEDKYMEMELLVKTVASSIREIKRLENKSNNK